MAITTEILYHHGKPIDVREMRDGSPRNYGRGETPANGYVVVRILAAKKDIPPEFLETSYDGKRRLNEAKMSVDEVALFKDSSRYTFLDHAVKHTITPQRLALICDDTTAAWEAIEASIPKVRDESK